MRSVQYLTVDALVEDLKPAAPYFKTAALLTADFIKDVRSQGLPQYGPIFYKHQNSWIALTEAVVLPEVDILRVQVVRIERE